MDETEDEILQKYGKQCGHCNRNTLLPYENMNGVVFQVDST